MDALSGERVAPDAAEVQLVLNVLGYGERFPFRPESRRSILADVLRRLLIAYGQHNPIVLVAEDMHWADDASVGVLSEVSEVVDSLPCLFLVTARPGWQPTWSAERLVLRPLERREAGLLAQAAARFELEPRVAERIVDRAEGNPFFLEELARSSNAASAEAPGVGQFGVPQVPPTIRELLQAQLDRLPAKTKRAVWAAAVCGRAFRLAIVQRLVPDLELVSELNTLQDEGLLVHGAVGSDAEYGFRHSLIHEVAYAMQLRDQRRSLHGAVGAALGLYPSRTDELVHELAFHYGRGSDAEKARTWLVAPGIGPERCSRMPSQRRITPPRSSGPQAVRSSPLRQRFLSAPAMCGLALVRPRPRSQFPRRSATVAGHGTAGWRASETQNWRRAWCDECLCRCRLCIGRRTDRPWWVRRGGARPDRGRDRAHRVAARQLRVSPRSALACSTAAPRRRT